MDRSRGFRLAAWTWIISSVGDVTVGAVASSVYLRTPLEPYWSTTQADMQLCRLEGELQTCLLQDTPANVRVEPAAAAAALARDKHRSQVDAIAPTAAVQLVLQLDVWLQGPLHL